MDTTPGVWLAELARPPKESCGPTHGLRRGPSNLQLSPTTPHPIIPVFYHSILSSNPSEICMGAAGGMLYNAVGR